MLSEEREIKIKQEYDEFIKTESGQKWRKGWQTRMGSDIGGDFRDFLYDFYPEILI